MISLWSYRIAAAAFTLKPRTTASARYYFYVGYYDCVCSPRGASSDNVHMLLS